MKKILGLDLHNHKSSYKLSFIHFTVTLKLHIVPLGIAFPPQSDLTQAHGATGLMALCLMFKPPGSGSAARCPLRPHAKCILRSVYLTVVSLSS